MTSDKLPTLLGGFVALLAAATLSHLFHAGWGACAAPSEPLAYLFAGLMLAISPFAAKRHCFLTDVSVSACAQWVVLIVVGITLAAATNTHLGIDPLFGEYGNCSAVASAPSISLGSVIGLLMLSVSGVSVVFNTTRFPKRLRWFGAALMGLGLSALCGHMWGIPELGLGFGQGLAQTSLFASVALAVSGAGCYVLGAGARVTQCSTDV